MATSHGLEAHFLQAAESIGVREPSERNSR